ncbi:hypothetical protein RB195_001037 [Necator americanus]|uniref:Uncharacterized protein n=1 Tax=Necator americanus TaxID=51031 RepID=A0ABR1DDR5_NECAM
MKLMDFRQKGESEEWPGDKNDRIYRHIDIENRQNGRQMGAQQNQHRLHFAKSMLASQRPVEKPKLAMASLPKFDEKNLLATPAYTLSQYSGQRALPSQRSDGMATGERR